LKDQGWARGAPLFNPLSVREINYNNGNKVTGAMLHQSGQIDDCKFSEVTSALLI
jgi:hypothetical protein